MRRGRWFSPGSGHRGPPPQPDTGVAPTANAAPRPPRRRAAIEADLRALPNLRTGTTTGDQRFGEIIAHRADRLLDELLRSGTCSEGASADSTSATSRGAGSASPGSASPAASNWPARCNGPAPAHFPGPAGESGPSRVNGRP